MSQCIRPGQATAPPLTAIMPRAGGRRWPVAVAVLVATATLLAACGVPAPSPTVAPATPAAPAPTKPAAPDFPLLAYQGEAVLGGRETSFTRLFAQGKPVVLNFWAGLCPPCRAEMPAFQRVADAYQDRLIVVGVDVGRFTGLGSEADARRLLADLGIRYPAAAAVDAAPLQHYRVRSMPTTVFLTARGEVAEQASGLLTEEQLRAAVERLLAAAEAGPRQEVAHRRGEREG